MPQTDIIDLLNGRTSGRHSGLLKWYHFECFYLTTNLREELIRYTGPSNWIADLLN